jgi:ribA/ribD-fused uncharacterized protein
MVSEIKGFFNKYRFLSNFYFTEVEYEGMKFPTIEHAYQAAKFTDPVMRFTIQQLTRPADARKYGKAKGCREDWEHVKFDIMYDLNAQKYAKPELGHLLLVTGNAYLEETNWWGDVYWGVCNGIGQNNLGKILMTIRAELRLILASR